MKDQGREETGEGIEASASEGLVKGVIKNRRDKVRDVKMFLQELKEGRGIIDEDILTF